MKAEIARIQAMLKYNWTGPMWYGCNLQAALSGITWEKAFQKPGAGSHDIYQLVMHMICWRKFVLEHLKGNDSYSVELNSPQDWATGYEHTEANWKAAIQELEINQNALTDALKDFPDSKLEEIVPGKKFNWYIFLHGVIHHDIYHSAQISILKNTPSVPFPQ